MNLAELIGDAYKRELITKFLCKPFSIETYPRRAVYDYRIGDSLVMHLCIPDFIYSERTTNEELMQLLFNENVNKIELLFGDYSHYIERGTNYLFNKTFYPVFLLGEESKAYLDEVDRKSYDLTYVLDSIEEVIRYLCLLFSYDSSLVEV